MFSLTTAIGKISLYILLMTVAIILHEIGHVIAYRWFTKKPINPKIDRWEWCIIDDDDLPKKDMFIVLFVGVIAGLIPFFVYKDAGATGLELAVLFILYFAGCKSDFIEMFKCLFPIRKGWVEIK